MAATGNTLLPQLARGGHVQGGVGPFIGSGMVTACVRRKARVDYHGAGRRELLTFLHRPGLGDQISLRAWEGDPAPITVEQICGWRADSRSGLVGSQGEAAYSETWAALRDVTATWLL